MTTAASTPAGALALRALLDAPGSLATGAPQPGALGSSLEHGDTVREATYGYRRRRRNEEMNTGDGPEDGSDPRS